MSKQKQTEMQFYCCSIFKSELLTDKEREDLSLAIDQCNKVIAEDFGPEHQLKECPDLLVMARNKESEVVGLLCLHFYDKTFAWEIGTCAARMPYRHTITSQGISRYSTGGTLRCPRKRISSDA